MGQHKFNKNSQLAKEGLIAPKPKGLSKREMERRLHKIIREKTGIDKFEALLNDTPYS